VRTLRTKLGRDLVRRKWQFLAVFVTITLGLMLYATSLDAFRNLEASYLATYGRLGFADLTVTGVGNEFGDLVGVLPGVAAVADRRRADVPLRVGEHQFLGRVIGMPPDSQPAVNKIDMIEGSYLTSSDPTGVVVEKHTAQNFGLGPGDRIEIFDGASWQETTISGIAISAEYIWLARSRQEIFPDPDQFGVAFVSESLLGGLTLPIVLDQTLILYEEDADPEELDASIGELAVRAGAAEVQTQAEQPSNAALQEDLRGFEEMSVLFPALFLTAAGMATFVLLTRLVYSQRAEIGTMMALGLRNRSILRHYASFGLLLGLSGAALGTAFGIALARLVTGVYTSVLSIPDTVTRFYPSTLVGGLLFGLGVGILSSASPARAAFKTSPAEAMRMLPPTAHGGSSLAERLIGPLRYLPSRWKLVLRGIGRSWRRSLSTIIGVVLALTLVLSSWGMIDTTTILVDRQFNEINLEDATVRYGVRVDPAVVEEAADTPGVATAERVAELPVTIQAGTNRYSTSLRAFEPDTIMHGFSDGTRDPPETGILIGKAVGDLLGVDRGERVELVFPGLSRTAATEVAGFVDEPVGSFVYAQLAETERLLAGAGASDAAGLVRSPAVAGVMTRFEPAESRQAVLRRLERLPGAVTVSDARALLDVIEQFLGFFYVFVGVMLVFGGTMAFALLFNTISVNISERSVELATLRANGYTGGQIARLVAAENLLLTSLGIAPGLLIGYVSAAAFMSSFSSDLFSFDLEMRGSTLVLSALAMVVVALLSLWPSLRAIGRFDIAQVVRERSL
jgi:putative ABC transport system permease protein